LTIGRQLTRAPLSHMYIAEVRTHVDGESQISMIAGHLHKYITDDRVSVINVSHSRVI